MSNNNINLKMSFKRLRQNTPLDILMRSNNISQADVCRLMKITPYTLMRIKKDFATHLTIKNLYKLSGILSIPATDILYLLERHNKVDKKDLPSEKHKNAPLYIDEKATITKDIFKDL